MHEAANAEIYGDCALNAHPSAFEYVLGATLLSCKPRVGTVTQRTGEEGHGRRLPWRKSRQIPTGPCPCGEAVGDASLAVPSVPFLFATIGIAAKAHVNNHTGACLLLAHDTICSVKVPRQHLTGWLIPVAHTSPDLIEKYFHGKLF